MIDSATILRNDHMRKLDLDTLKTVSGGGGKDSGYGHDKGDKGGKGGKGKDKS